MSKDFRGAISEIQHSKGEKSL